ncbi:MAG: hypothetical protein ACI8WB_001090 [Phenylobacterium sp.]
MKKFRNIIQLLKSLFSTLKVNQPKYDATTSRVEPTFNGEHSDTGTEPESASQQPSHHISTPTMADKLEPLQVWLQGHRRLSLSLAGIFLLLITTLLLWPSSEDSQTVEAEQPVEAKTPASQQLRQHALEMPNNYWLMQDQHQALIIHWPSYDKNNEQLWSILTAKGESSCQEVVFSANSTFRTNQVSVEDDGNYYASFSPLDSEALLHAIADKNTFSLCGYEFSLKGSRAAISRSEVFSAYL